MMEKWKLIIFDMDGLMFDTEQMTMKIYLQTAKEMGLETCREDYIRVIGQDSRRTCEAYRSYFGEDFDAMGLYRKVGKRLRKEADENGIPAKAGLKELLTHIRESGIPMAVASGSSLSVIAGNLDKEGIQGYFSGLFSSEDLERGKPAPDIFLHVCKKMDVLPQDSLVLEDSPLGIRAALAGGLPVIAVPDLVPLPDGLKEKCLAVVDSLDQVIPYI